jgi:uncharacterized protein GlcG (DUF336 family)
MSSITLAQAQTIITAGLQAARDKKFQPLAIVVLDARGVLKAYAAEDGTSLRRAEIATGKAHGALAFGVGSRTLGKRAEERPHFIAAATHAVACWCAAQTSRSSPRSACPATPRTMTRRRRWRALLRPG